METFYNFFVREGVDLKIVNPILRDLKPVFNRTVQYTNKIINDVFEQQGLYRAKGPKYRIIIPSNINSEIATQAMKYDEYESERQKVMNYLNERAVSYSYFQDIVTTLDSKGREVQSKIGRFIQSTINDINALENLFEKLFLAHQNNDKNLEFYKSRFMAFKFTYPTKEQFNSHKTIWGAYSIKMLQILEKNPLNFKDLAGKTIHKYNDRKTLANKILDIYMKDPFRSFKIKNNQSKLSIIISRHPYDIMGASTGRHWVSCKKLDPNARTGMYSYDYVTNELKTRYKNGLIVSYLIYADDYDIKKPLGRIFLEPYVLNGQIAYGPSLSCYGLVNENIIQEYKNELINWINKNINSKLQKGIYKLNDELTPEAPSEIEVK